MFITDPLENEEALMNDLEMFAVIARCKYTDSKTAIVNFFDPNAQRYHVIYIIYVYLNFIYE